MVLAAQQRRAMPVREVVDEPPEQQEEIRRILFRSELVSLRCASREARRQLPCLPQQQQRFHPALTPQPGRSRGRRALVREPRHLAARTTGKSTALLSLALERRLVLLPQS